jgi:hypothetical protein
MTEEDHIAIDRPNFDLRADTRSKFLRNLLIFNGILALASGGFISLVMGAPKWIAIPLIVIGLLGTVLVVSLGLWRLPPLALKRLKIFFGIIGPLFGGFLLLSGVGPLFSILGIIWIVLGLLSLLSRIVVILFVIWLIAWGVMVCALLYNEKIRSEGHRMGEWAPYVEPARRVAPHA